jgi:hypothetical protein
LFLCVFFAFYAWERASRAGRQSVSPAAAVADTNNKEVPLNAREGYPEMQRVQAEKLQYDEEQEEHSG